MRPDVDEALRYLGAGGVAPEELRQQVAAAADELAAAIQPRYTYKIYNLDHADGRICLRGSGIVLTGETAERMLAQCDQAALLACTLGAAFDARLLAAQARDMARAVILDACGSAFVESGCDAAEQEISARFPSRYRTDRFSPGYGDLPLSLQPDICAGLDTARRLGVHVTESLILNPVKSVTAVIGLSDKPQMARIRGCGFCSMRETCLLRKGGKHCAP
ncbi:MAG: methionine synthase [Oscillospiraceae bacterium]